VSAAARRIWFQREFPLGVPVGAFPDIVERLRGTPLRLEERLGALPAAQRTVRLEGDWSAQENAGHLGDLETLWSTRVEELCAGKRNLAAADLQNRKTEEAGHNDREMAAVLGEFAAARQALVARLESLGPETLRHEALHPRLQQPMTLVDLCFFVAEHDDHHLARISEIHKTLAGRAGAGG
jgi:uncharacterized damage-inducible protein DinB